jgi:orotate phosphoribosyltransferase
MEADKIFKLFKKTRAIQSGHFKLTSGLHSDTYVQCARILEKPVLTKKLCKVLAAPWATQKVDVVVGPAVGGIIIAYELSRILKARAIYLERADGKLTLRRGFIINPEETVLVTEDVVTTGGSVQEVIDVVKAQGGKLIGVASLVNRNPEQSLFGAEFNALLKITPVVYQPNDCPLCKAGKPITQPGSRGLK